MTAEAGKRLRVIVVADGFPKLSESFVLNEVVGLMMAGHDVSVLARKEITDEIRHESFGRFNVAEATRYLELPDLHRLRKLGQVVRAMGRCLIHGFLRPFLAFNFLRFGGAATNGSLFLAAASLRGALSADIIHAHFGPVGVVCEQLRRLGVLQGRLITSFHGYDFTTVEARGWRQSYAPLLRAGDGFIANSEFTRNGIVALGALPERVHLIPVCYDDSVFTRASAPREEPKVILSVGRLVEMKGHVHGLRAMAALCRMRPDLKFKYVICGDGELGAELGNEASSLGITNVVEFVEGCAQGQVAERMKAAAIFLLPSVVAADGLVETQGLVVQEAQACSTPVVVSDVGGAAEGLLPGESGFVIDIRNYEQVARVIADLLDDDEKREQMGAAGAQFVESKYTRQQIVAELERAFSQLAGRQPAADRTPAC